MTKLHLVSLAFLLMMACNFLTLFGPASTPMPTPTSTRAYVQAPTRVPTRTPTRVIVTALDHLYLRRGPGMLYAASNDVLNWGETMEFGGVCEKDAFGGWWLRVSVDTREGWVSQHFVEPKVCQ